MKYQSPLGSNLQKQTDGGGIRGQRELVDTWRLKFQITNQEQQNPPQKTKHFLYVFLSTSLAIFLCSTVCVFLKRVCLFGYSLFSPNHYSASNMWARIKQAVAMTDCMHYSRGNTTPNFAIDRNAYLHQNVQILAQTTGHQSRQLSLFALNWMTR